MARSRPKLSQAPWTGLEAIRKIMERFSEFGENLNRMAAALHHLETNMQHLLGVTSRVTAAMLLLHGSLSHVHTGGSRGGGGGGKPLSDEDREKRDKERTEKFRAIEAERDEKARIRDELKTLRQSLSNARYAKSMAENELSKRARIRGDVFYKDMMYRRRRAESEIEQTELNPEALLSQKGEYEKLVQAQGALPSDKNPYKVVVDTEYGFVGNTSTGEAAKDNYANARAGFDLLSDPEKDLRKALTQLNVRVVNNLGQTLHTLTRHIKHDLEPGQEIFSLKDVTEEQQKDFSKKLKEAPSVSMAEAISSIKKFSTESNLDFGKLAASSDFMDPKFIGRFFSGADFKVLTNPINKSIGDALGMNLMSPTNLGESISDPVVTYFKGVITRLGTLKNPDMVAKIGQEFGLNPEALKAAVGSGKKDLSQEAMAKIFNVEYGAGGAHTAEADTEVYGKLMARIMKMDNLLRFTIDREAIYLKHGVTSSDMLEAREKLRTEHETDPENLKIKEELKKYEELIEKISKEEKALFDSLKDRPEKPPEETKPKPEPSPKSSWEKIKDIVSLKNIDMSLVMGKGFKDMVDCLKILPKQIASGIVATAGATMGLAQMASPDVFATFQGSLQILGASIGGALLKPMLTLSYYIQKLANDFQNMSPETEKLIGTIGEWAISLGVGVVALKAITMVISPLATAFKGFWGLMKGLYGLTFGGGILSGLQKMGAWLTANGKFLVYTLRAAGALAILGEAAASLADTIFGTKYSMSSRILEKMDESFKEAEKTKEKNFKDATIPETQKALQESLENKEKDEASISPLLRSNAEMNKYFQGAINLASFAGGKQPAKITKTEMEGFRDRFAQANQLYGNALLSGDRIAAEKNLGTMSKIFYESEQYVEEYINRPANATSPLPITATITNKDQREAFKRFSLAVEAQDLPGRVNPKGVTQDAAKNREIAKKKFEEMGGFQGLAAAFQSFRGQPQYMGVEEAHRRVQIQALGMDPLQQKLNEIQQVQLKRMIELLAQINAKGPDAALYGSVINMASPLIQGKP